MKCVISVIDPGRQFGVLCPDYNTRVKFDSSTASCSSVIFTRLNHAVLGILGRFSSDVHVFMS